MKNVELILQGISDGDTIGGPFAMASLVAKVLANDPHDFDALDKAYCDYYDSGSFDSGPTFHKVHELMANGYARNEAVEATHKIFRGSTAGCNPMHRFIVIAGLDVPYEKLVSLARRDAKMTHHDPRAGICSGFLVRVVRRCLDGTSLKMALDTVLNESSKYDRKLLDIELSREGFAPSVINTAMAFCLDSDDGLTASIEYARPYNYCPPLVGALLRCESERV